MTKEMRERLDRQLADIRNLITEIDEVSARLRRAADVAMEMLSEKGPDGGNDTA